MILKITDFYSYLLQEEEDITAAYFKTNTGTEYRVYFYPVSEYFEMLRPDTKLYHCGYFFGFTKLAPDEKKIEPLDFRIRNTIFVIINKFFEEKGIDKVLIFYCDDDDGKKYKRSTCFDLWYQLSETKMKFQKFDEEIVIIDENGNKADTDYMSLIAESANSDIDNLLEEFQFLKEQLIANK